MTFKVWVYSNFRNSIYFISV